MYPNFFLNPLSLYILEKAGTGGCNSPKEWNQGGHFLDEGSNRDTND